MSPHPRARIVHARWKRAAALAAFAVFGTVAAFASIAPAEDATLLLAKTAVRETLNAPAVVLPAPTTYVREARLGQGDTIGNLLGRLGIGDADARLVLGRREIRLLRPGSIVNAETRAGERAGELVWLEFVSRDNVVRLEKVADSLVASE